MKALTSVSEESYQCIVFGRVCSSVGFLTATSFGVLSQITTSSVAVMINKYFNDIVYAYLSGNVRKVSCDML